jgi:hypothetical protein
MPMTFCVFYLLYVSAILHSFSVPLVYSRFITLDTGWKTVAILSSGCCVPEDEALGIRLIGAEWVQEMVWKLRNKNLLPLSEIEALYLCSPTCNLIAWYLRHSKVK